MVDDMKMALTSLPCGMACPCQGLDVRIVPSEPKWVEAKCSTLANNVGDREPSTIFWL